MLRIAFQVLEEVGPDQRRGELGARGDGVVAELQGDVHVGVLEGGDPRQADPGGGDDLAGRIPEFAVDHQAVARGEQVRHGGAAAEALDLLRREPGVGVQPSDRLCGELRVGVGERPRRGIDGIVALFDLVIVQDPPLYPGGQAVDPSHDRFDMVVVDGVVGQVCGHVVDVYLHAFLHFSPVIIFCCEAAGRDPKRRRRTPFPASASG